MVTSTDSQQELPEDELDAVGGGLQDDGQPVNPGGDDDIIIKGG